MDWLAYYMEYGWAEKSLAGVIYGVAGVAYGIWLGRERLAGVVYGFVLVSHNLYITLAKLFLPSRKPPNSRNWTSSRPGNKIPFMGFTIWFRGRQTPYPLVYGFPETTEFEKLDVRSAGQ
jgi:hypothetical protein